MTFESDEEKFAAIKGKLYTAVVSDVLDGLGFCQQVMRGDIRPLHPDYVVAGRARTLVWVDYYEIREDLYWNMIRAVDSLKPGDVYVACVQSPGFSWRNACVGELVATAAKKRGAAGAIVDSLVRDAKDIIALGFPVFARGLTPVASRRSYVEEVDVVISCGDVTVHPGELVFGDYDGIVVIPREAEEETLARALEKVAEEDRVRQEIERGKLLEQVYKGRGIL